MNPKCITKASDGNPSKINNTLISATTTNRQKAQGNKVKKTKIKKENWSYLVPTSRQVATINLIEYTILNEECL